MRTAASEMIGFYDGPLGGLAARFIGDKIVEAWGDAHGLCVAGYGYASPYLPRLTEATKRVALTPAGLGIARDEGLPAARVADALWPLPNESLDRLLIVHGLEEAPEPRRMLREAWRVLADDGLLIVVCANRRGLWALAERTPFGAGRPYSRSQLDALLRAAMFAPTAYAQALHFPPLRHEALLGLAGAWERLGDALTGLPILLPSLAGVNLIEARKGLAAPVSGSKAEVFGPVFAGGGLKTAQRASRADTT